MRLEAKKYLFDIQRAAALIAEFTSGLSLEDYQSRPMVRAAVEREFEIVGEALAQLVRSTRQWRTASAIVAASWLSGTSSCTGTPMWTISWSGT
jgi:uncharacterized protein with HEPN domain